MIDAEQLEHIFLTCLFTEQETEGKKVEALKGIGVLVEGITATFCFVAERIEEYRDKIDSMVEQLPDAFWEARGGGYSFLNACHDREGHQWGEHRNMEQLVVLGIAIGRMEYCTPRSLWDSLPGGMPYVVVREKKKVREPTPAEKIIIGKAVEEMTYGICIGAEAQMTGKGSIAFGAFAEAHGDGAMALGYRAYAEGKGAMAVGDGMRAVGDGVVAVSAEFELKHLKRIQDMIKYACSMA